MREIKLRKVEIDELGGIDIGGLYELAFVKTRAMIEGVRKMAGFYRARKLYIEPTGELLIEDLTRHD